MSSASTSNVSSSGATPPTARPPQGRSLSEASYLEEQAANAKAAIKQSLAEAKDALTAGLKPGEWAGRHPWITLGGAAVAGFVVATQFVPSKEEQALKKLAAYERALHPPKVEDHHATSENGDQRASSSGGRGFLQTMLSDVIRSMGPALASALTAGAASHAAAKSATQEGVNSAPAGSSPPES